MKDLEFARKIGGEENTILRENSLCTKFITLISTTVAKNYLRRLVGPLVAETASGSCEFSEDWYIKQGAEVIHMLKHLIPQTPRTMRAVCFVIAELSERYCPDRKYPLIAGYLFLRLINPCLASPEPNGLIPDEMLETGISAEGRQALLVMMKVFQHLSNNTKFTQYPRVAAWIEETRPLMEEFLDRMVYDENNVEEPFSDKLGVEVVATVNPSDLGNQMVLDLHSILFGHYAALKAIRKRLQKSNSDELVSLYDVLFECMDEMRTDGRSLSQSLSSIKPDARSADGTSPRFMTNDKGTMKTPDSLSMGNMRTKLKNLVSGKSSKTLREGSLFDRINTEDLSLCSNLDLWTLIRAMTSKENLGKCFYASDAMTWVEEQLSLSHRGNALILLRMLEEKCLIGSDACSKILDDNTVYNVNDSRFQVWDGYLGRTITAEHEELNANIKNICSKVFVAVTSVGSLDDSPNAHENLHKLAMNLAVCMRGWKNRSSYEIQEASEFFVIFGELSSVQSISLLRFMAKNNHIRSLPVGQNISAEDATLLLNCVSVAFGSHRGRHAKLWDRQSLILLLMGNDGSYDASRDPFKSNFLLNRTSSDLQRCQTSEFHSSLQKFLGKGKSKTFEHWLSVWKDLEDLGFLKGRQILQMNQATNEIKEPLFWFVTSAGMEFIIDRQSDVPLVFTFDDSILENCINTPESSKQGVQGGKFFVLKRGNSEKVLRKSGDFEGEFGSSSSDIMLDRELSSSKRSPRSASKILQQKKKPSVVALRSSEVRRASKSVGEQGDRIDQYSTATPEPGDSPQPRQQRPTSSASSGYSSPGYSTPTTTLGRFRTYSSEGRGGRNK